VLQEEMNGNQTSLTNFLQSDHLDEMLGEVAVDSNGNNARSWFHMNRQNSMCAVSNETEASQFFNYDSKGGIYATQPFLPNRRLLFGYTGRVHDLESSLIFFRTRYYCPRAGRFARRDPIGYVDGNNLVAEYFSPWGTDPFGLSADDPGGDIFNGSGYYDCRNSHSLSSPGLNGGKFTMGPINVSLEYSLKAFHKTCYRDCKDCPGTSVEDEASGIAIQAKFGAKGGPWSGTFNKGGWAELEYFIGIEVFGEVTFAASAMVLSDRCNRPDDEVNVCGSGAGKFGARGGMNGTVRMGRKRFKVGGYGEGSVNLTLTACLRCRPGGCSLKSVKLCGGYDLSIHANMFVGSYEWNLASRGWCTRNFV
jgi:RHS repeat-associated protein